MMTSSLQLVHLAVLLGVASSASAFFQFASNDDAISTFVLRDCGSASAAVRFNHVSITPSPIAIPGSMRVAVDVDILRNITGPMLAEVNVYRKLSFASYFRFWIDVTPPCFGDNCLTDMCAEFERIVADVGCPSEITDNGFECTCPPPPRSYQTRSDIPLVVPITDDDLPPEIFRDFISGTYKVQSTAFDGNGERLGCYEMEFGLIHRPT